MKNLHIARSTLLLAILSLFLPLRAGAVQQWRRWEQTITSNKDFTASQGNPYRDLILRVKFTNQATGETFTQDAFWDGVLGNPTRFKVRSAFPPGTWSWQIAGCIGSTGGQSCASGVTWTPSSGTISVTAATTGINLFDRGFLMQLQFITGAGTTGYSQILYGDQSNFYWAGDTAWAAPAREAEAVLYPPGQPSTWPSFLADRKTKGFTSVLLAPAVAWKPNPGENWNGLHDAQDFSFKTISGCSTANPVIPNDCSYPRPEYWNVLDNLVEQANAQSIAVLMAGLIDPVDLGKDGTYPNLANARDFARYLAARLAGNFVIFSPGFDDRPASNTRDGLNTVQSVVAAVGPDIKTAAPRHLVTNHLSASATCSDYLVLQSSSWMTLYMFQSGHGADQRPGASTVCPGRVSGETVTQAALRRAREMPLTLKTSSTNPAKPNFNSEGPYDRYPNETEPDTRYRVRQAGHISSLSDSQGFTYGVTNMGIWDFANTYFGIDSAKDMQQLFLRFKNRAGLPARHSWILNQPAAPNHDQMMALASNTSSLVLAYLPKEATQIVINTSSLSGLACGGTWTMTWFVPTTNRTDLQSLNCTQGTNQITVKRPQNCPAPIENPDCDWVLEIQRTGPGLTSPALSPGQEGLDVWADFSAADGTSAIYVSPTPSLQAKLSPVLLSPAGKAFQQSPRVARHGDGYFVVWHGDGLDGSLYGVFARRIDRNGHLLSEPFQVNTYTQHDQRDPAAASAPSGEAVVVWSSYGQDGDLGGIFGQRFDRFGKLVGEEFAINTERAGHQVAPQVAFDATGNFVVAWTTEAGETSPSSISVRRFDRNGKPLADEFRLSSPVHSFVHLVDLAVSAQGDFSVRWAARDLRNHPLGQFLQHFDIMGRSADSPAPVEGAE